MQLTDLSIGMKVRLSNDSGLNHDLRGQMGLILFVGRDHAMVQCGNPPHSWYFRLDSLRYLLPISPEQIERYEDQKRREAHADKYL